jgi:hypothetical protein
MSASPSNSPSRGTMLAVALLVGGFGLYFSLIGLGVVPIPGGPKNLSGPLWVLLAVGLAFLLGAIAVVLQDEAGANPETGELPKDAPSWVRMAQRLIGFAIFVCFALIGSWVAFGPGERQFSGTVPVGPTTGRIAFGIGAVIMWVAVIGIAVGGIRKLLKSRTANGE